MVGFDAHFVMLAFRPAIPASVPRAKERVEQLLIDLQKAGERIVIPTPSLTEFLVHAGTAGPQYLDTIQKSVRFKISPFGLRASVEVAAAIKASIKKGNKRGGSTDTWAKVNFDRQIAAISKVEGCHTLYSDDPGLKLFAQKLGLKVLSLADLDLPPSKTPLLDKLDELDEEEKTIKGTDKNSTGLQPDSARGTGDATRTEEGGHQREKKEEG